MARPCSNGNAKGSTGRSGWAPCCNISQHHGLRLNLRFVLGADGAIADFIAIIIIIIIIRCMTFCPVDGKARLYLLDVELG